MVLARQLERNVRVRTGKVISSQPEQTGQVREHSSTARGAPSSTSCMWGTWAIGIFGRAGRHGSHVKDQNKERKDVRHQCLQGYGVEAAQRLELWSLEKEPLRMAPNDASCAHSIMESAMGMLYLPAGVCAFLSPGSHWWTVSLAAGESAF